MERPKKKKVSRKSREKPSATTARYSMDTHQAIVNESAGIYINNMPGHTYNAMRWLGLTGDYIISAFDYITHGKTGITKASLDNLSEYLGISRKKMAEEVLDISVKTLERKAANTRLNKKISSHAIEIARIMEHAFEVFGTDEQVKIWVNTPNKALNGLRPIALMDTMTGLQLIDDVLSRIQEGVFS